MRKILLLAIAWCLCFTAMAQGRTVTGKVTAAEDGTVLPGVSVVIKGTTTGTVTDANGSYTLLIPEGGTILSFSFIGLKAQEVEIGNRAVIDVQMTNDVTQLSEIVVTGYSETSQRNLVSAIGSVGSQSLQNVALTDVSQMLQGRAAGVQSASGTGQPGAVQSIRIRGTSTLTSGQGPLYVIDGIPVTSGDLTQGGGNAANTASPGGTNDVLASINPNDIESVTILKDAAATSLYGSRGGNGVVLITTKRGKSGDSSITARAQFGVTIPNMGHFKVMNGQQDWTYERDVLALSGTPQNVIDQMRPESKLDSAYNWVDAAFRTGKTSNYEIQTQGGDNKTRFFVSGGVYSQDGTLIHSDFKRYSMRANLDHRVNEKLDISLNMNVSYTDQNNARAGSDFASPLAGSFTTTPLQNPINPNTGKYFIGSEYNYIGFTGDNFLYSSDRNYVRNNTLRSLGKVALGYEITKDIKFTQTLGVDLIQIREKNWFDPTTNDGAPTNGQLIMAQNQDLTLTSQSKLAGGWTIGEKHNLDALAIMEVQKNTSSQFASTGTGFASPQLQTLNSAALPQGVAGSDTGYSFLSYIGQANYNYSDKYFLTASFRRDGSSRFGADNRFANFWSLGTSWRVIDEEFMKGSNTFSDLKLRASYGTAGNANILVGGTVSNFPSLELYGFGPAYNGQPGSQPSQIANPKLTWEQSTTLNIGVDVGIFHDRIRATVDAYNKISESLLLSVPVSSTSGFTTALRNIGRVRNHGIEGTLSTVNVEGAVRWTTDFNITINRSKILELPDGADIIDPNVAGQLFRQGQPLNSFYLRQWAGVNPADGTPLWRTADGGTTGSYAAATRFIVGNSQPRFMGGFNNTVTYKGFTLSVFFYYALGHQIYNQSRSFMEDDGARFGWNHLVTAGEDYWKKPGDIVSRPKPINGGNNSSSSPSSRYIENGSYLRLRNVLLSYSLPTNVLGTSAFRGARVYVQAQNLLTWTKYSGFDPEIDASGSEFFRYPVGKSVTGGIELTF
ncbi:MAG: TonB-dependent receptor [Bacteroidota bacterium]